MKTWLTKKTAAYEALIICRKLFPWRLDPVKEYIRMRERWRSDPILVAYNEQKGIRL